MIRLAVCLTLAVMVVALPSVALAQTLESHDASVFVALLPGLIALSTQVTTALRDALTAQVPPSWLTISAVYRPWVAAGVGAAVAFLASLSAAEATGGDPMSKAMLLAAFLAALANLAITLPKLIHAERVA